MSDNTTNVPLKRCKYCGTEFPNNFHHFGKCGNSGKYLRRYCYACDYYRRTHPPEPEPAPQTWVCRACKRELPFTDEHFPRQKGTRYGLVYLCRDCASKKSKRWAKDNPERHNQKNRETRKQKPQHYRAIARIATQRYRARKRDVGGEYTIEDLQAQFTRQNGKCYWCNEDLDPENYQADHVIPVSRGGSNGPENIVCACAWCNQSKSDRLPHEWSGNGGKLL